jgi:hypothetical protein
MQSSPRHMHQSSAWEPWAELLSVSLWGDLGTNERAIAQLCAFHSFFQSQCVMWRFMCAGINRHEAEEEEALQERSSDPLGLESCAATARDAVKRR